MTVTTARRVAIGGVAISTIAFLLMHTYQPAYGVVWNALHGEIELTPACWPGQVSALAPTGDLQFSDLIPARSSSAQTTRPDLNFDYGPKWWCGNSIPYKWVLIAAIALVAFCFASIRPKS